jgi:hypothetical protein
MVNGYCPGSLEGYLSFVFCLVTCTSIHASPSYMPIQHWILEYCCICSLFFSCPPSNTYVGYNSLVCCHLDLSTVGFPKVKIQKSLVEISLWIRKHRWHRPYGVGPQGVSRSNRGSEDHPAVSDSETLANLHGCNLVGGFNLPLLKMMEFVSWDWLFPTEWKVIKHVPNHQPVKIT